ncbi:MAG TPA: hypothetical protein ENK18_18410 [Deltaproteobacteria bacterium]|nr:hypothetical protein [Deltaproteobacteria bacterium]
MRFLPPQAPAEAPLLSQLLARRPGVVLSLVAALILLMSTGLSGLSSRFDLVELYAASTGREAAPATVMIALPDGSTSAEVDEASEALRALPVVTDTSVLRVPDGLPPSVAEQLGLAMWGRAGARYAIVRAQLADGDRSAQLDALAPVASDHDAVLLGLPVLDQAHRHLARSQTAQLLLVVSVVFALVLSLLWRRPAAALVPLLSVGIGVLGLLGLLGHFDQPLGGPMLALVPLTVVLGLTDAIHVVWRLHEALEHGPAAVADALSGVARACAWTSVTTGAGFLALIATSSPILRRFGLWAAVGMFLVWITGVWVPAALLVRFPSLAPRPRRLVLPPLVLGPWLRVVGGLALTGGLLSLASRLEIDLIPGNDLPADHRVLEAHLLHDAALGGLHPLQVDVFPDGELGTADPDAFLALVELQRTAVNHPAVGSVVSFADAMLIAGQASHRTVEQLAGRPGDRRRPRIMRFQRIRERALREAEQIAPLPLDDGRRWTMHLRLHHVPASGWQDLFDHLQRATQGRVRIELSGYPTLIAMARDQIVSDALWVFGLGGGVAPLCLALLTRDLRTAAAAIPMLGLTGLAVLAGLAVIEVPLSHANLFALSVAVGTALDPWIHLHAAKRSDPQSTPPIAVGQGLVILGLLLLGTSRITTLAQAGPVLAGAMAVNLFVTGALWSSSATRRDPAARPRR